MILPQKWVVRAITELKKQEITDTLQSYMNITLMYLAGMFVTLKRIPEYTEPTRRRLPHCHTGLAFDEGKDENGNMLEDASPLHT
jgi:hypothetical protein